MTRSVWAQLLFNIRDQISTYLSYINSSNWIFIVPYRTFNFFFCSKKSQREAFPVLMTEDFGFSSIYGNSQEECRLHDFFLSPVQRLLLIHFVTLIFNCSCGDILMNNTKAMHNSKWHPKPPKQKHIRYIKNDHSSYILCHIVHLIHMQSTFNYAADLRLYDHTCNIKLNFQGDLACDWRVS